MKNTLLLPRGFRITGLILFVPFLALFIATFNYNFTFGFLNTPVSAKDAGDFLAGNHNLTDELAIAGCITSLFMIAFSRQKQEDEYIRFIRLRSLQIGVYTNYAVFLLLTFTVFGGNYLSVLFLNIITTLVLFILVFYFNLHVKPLFSKSATI